MIPRGISHAASGAEAALPLNILDAGKPAASDRTGRFARELNREVLRQRQTTENSKPDGMQFREVERTKESNLDKTKGPEAAWKKDGRTSTGREEKINSGRQLNENEATRKAAHSTKQPELGDDLSLVLEEWVVNFLKAALTRRVDYPGPGGGVGPDEGELGPRFAIPAPTAITSLRGNPVVSQNPEAVWVELPLSESPIPGGDIARNLSDIPPTAGNYQPTNSNIELLASEKAAKGTGNVPLNKGISNAGDESPVTIEVISNKNAVGNLAELIAKAVEAANNAFRNIALQSAEGLGGDKPFTLQAVIDAGFEALGFKGILKQGKPDDASPLADKGPSAIPAAPEGMPNILNKPEQFNFRDVNNTQHIPDDEFIGADIERKTQDFNREMITGVKLRLHPPELGNLVVEFRRDEHGLRIEFHTANQAVLKALEVAGPKMMERLEDAGVDVGSLDVFLSNDGAMGRGIISPLDNPNNSPDSAVSEGEMNIAAGGEDAVSMRYLAYDTSTIDLVV